jgi:hypothetical protein
MLWKWKEWFCCRCWHCSINLRHNHSAKWRTCQWRVEFIHLISHSTCIYWSRIHGYVSSCKRHSVYKKTTCLLSLVKRFWIPAHSMMIMKKLYRYVVKPEFSSTIKAYWYQIQARCRLTHYTFQWTCHDFQTTELLGLIPSVQCCVVSLLEKRCWRQQVSGNRETNIACCL